MILATLALSASKGEMPGASSDIWLQWIAVGSDKTPKNLWHGQIAGQRIQSSLPCIFLPTALPFAAWQRPIETQPLQYDCVAELEGRAVNLQFRHSQIESRFVASREKVQFGVNPLGSHAWLETHSSEPPATWLFGPPLILALARRNVFCLHASAVSVMTEVGSKAVLILGKSGVGKSTTAAISGQNRLTDDISPVSINARGEFNLHPHFPQLKLAYPDVDLPETLPIAGLAFLQPRATEQCIAPITDSKDLVRRLLSHTVGARLYSAADIQRYLHVLAQLSAALLRSQMAVSAHARNDASAPMQAQADLFTALSARFINLEKTVDRLLTPIKL